MPRALFFCLPLLAIAAPGQDVFNAVTPSNSCQQLRDEENRVYATHMAAIKQRLDELQAQRASEDALRQIDLERRDEEARHDKRTVDIDSTAACNPSAQARTPCEQAKAAESLRYHLAMAQLKKDEIDEWNRAYHAKSDCRGDGGCIAQADKESAIRIRAISAKRAAETSARDRKFAEIDDTICQTQDTFDGSSTGPRTNLNPPPCVTEPNPDDQNMLTAMQQESIRTLSGAGQQADIMLSTMGKLMIARLQDVARGVPATLNYLSQRGAGNRFLIQQALQRVEAARAVADYVIYTESRSRVNQQVWQQLHDAVTFAQRNPAAAIGVAADQVLWNKLQGMAAGGVCTAASAAAQKARLGIEAAKAKAAASGVNQLLKGDVDAAGAICGPGEGNVQNNPFAPADKRDCFNRFMLNATGDKKWLQREDTSRGMLWDRAVSTFRKQFGGLKAKNPYHGPLGLPAHALGMPVASSVPRIRDALQKAGPGSEAGVIVQWQNGGRHIFNAANMGGHVLFWDDQQKKAATGMFIDQFGKPAAKIWIYRYK